MPSSVVTGWTLIIVSYLWLMVNTYTMILSKLLPMDVNNEITKDRHYCLIPPAMPVVFVLFVIVNWLGLKYFRHN